LTTLNRLPLERPAPDAGRFIDALMGRILPERPPLVEYLVDEVLMRPITTALLGRRWVDYGADRASQSAWLDNFIAFWQRMGYDFVRFEQAIPFTFDRLLAPDTAPGSTKTRAWADQHGGAIRSWEDLERYRWPRLEEVDFFPFEYINAHMPEGMGLMTCHAGGIFEHLSYLMSYEGLCLALHDDPELVRAISDRVGELMIGFYRHLLSLDRVIAIFPGDDMGFRTATLVSPADLRRYFLPWHKRFAEMTHARGVPYFVHSCGRVMPIMEDLIEDVRIDGKHSYEDAIMPVADFQARYGDRIAVLGGLDVHILSTATTEEVRRHTRRLMETCGPRGRYAVGSGNSVPSYVPVDNYMAMVDEALC
jgi:uroporphyrinogen decarboxylase